MSLFTKLFGTSSQRELKSIYPIADKVDALEEEYKALTDAQLQAKTPELKERLAKGETLDDILPEAFAACREAAWRVLGLRPYRVQVVGGIVLHQGRIAEMKTGEGKTLVATLPAYLNALTGEGVHIVTVNDYLAKRDSEQMGKVFRFMGLTVGLVIQGVKGEEKKAAYQADITYGTNNEFGFDYLRDNMTIYPNGLVQRGHAFAIVDEVDSILIDEARTPLIISVQEEEAAQLYTIVDQFVSKLSCKRVVETDSKEEEDVNIDADYIVDEKSKTATLTARGIKKAEEAFHVSNLADMENTTLSHHINQAIKAYGVMQRDIDYVVKDGQVIIVDEFTGRLMFGRRYNEGLHQAIEAKEGVEVAGESKTLATITFQNYFRLYNKLSGMTGTALTEEQEFGDIYKLDIVEIPTNKPLARIDRPDVVYKNVQGKLRAIVAQIEECHAKGQPVLIGTVSIEKSEELSDILKKKGILHNVLNAKNHEKEAEIVAQAGKFGAVTVATNMAGRGTDIMLGGNAEFLAKADLRKAGMSDELIAEATGFAETDDQEILDAREAFQEAEARYKAEIQAEADRVWAQAQEFAQGGKALTWSFQGDSGLTLDELHKVCYRDENGNLIPVDPATVASGFIFPAADPVTYHGRSYNRADLSAETLEWLDWYLALSEEEQLAVSYEPAELRGGELPTTEDAGAEQPAAEEELPPFVPEYDPQVEDSTPVSPDTPVKTLAVCPVEGCTAGGTHTHDGATYLCSGGHCGGVCDGSCAAGVPSGGRHHGAGNGVCR